MLRSGVLGVLPVRLVGVEGTFELVERRAHARDADRCTLKIGHGDSRNLSEGATAYRCRVQCVNDSGIKARRSDAQGSVHECRSRPEGPRKRIPNEYSLGRPLY